MNYFSSLMQMKNSNSSLLNLVGLFLLLASTVSTSAPDHATYSECQLPTNYLIKPAIIDTMSVAADKGYLYRVDTGTSNVEFQVDHFPFSRVIGHFSSFQGGMTLPGDNNDQPRQALFLIKVDSVETGDDDVDDYIKSPVFFDATQFPDIIFVSTGFEWIDDSTARLLGELTLRGMTRPIIFIAHIDKTEDYDIDQNQKVNMIASAEIQRSEFGMRDMQVFVSDTVRFDLNIVASRVGI